MTVGTAIVLSVAILCVTFLATLGIGAAMSRKKNLAAAALTSTLTDEINKRIKDKLK